MADVQDARAALLEWLAALAKYATSARGMAVALIRDDTDPGVQHPCDRLIDGGEPLLRRVIDEGAVPGEVTTADLVTLVTGIVLATERHRDPAAEVDRLLAIAVAGISPQR